MLTKCCADIKAIITCRLYNQRNTLNTLLNMINSCLSSRDSYCSGYSIPVIPCLVHTAHNVLKVSI